MVPRHTCKESTQIRKIKQQVKKKPNSILPQQAQSKWIMHILLMRRIYMRAFLKEKEANITKSKNLQFEL